MRTKKEEGREEEKGGKRDRKIQRQEGGMEGGRKREREATIELLSGLAHTPQPPPGSPAIRSCTRLVSPPGGIFWPQGGSLEVIPRATLKH